MRNIFRVGNSVQLPMATGGEPIRDGETLNVDKAVEAGLPPVVNTTNPVDNDDSTFTSGAQDGVKKMEATTMVWTKSHLIAAYVLMWFVTFVDAMQQGTSGALTPFVTSSFMQHSLTAYTGIMANIIGGVIKLPLAKVLISSDVPQGFLIMTGFLVLGLIMMAACNGVQTFAAAQIFYWVGYNGISYTISVFIADTSHLKNRGFMYAYVSSPYIVTVWITGPMATAFMTGPGWRWFYGAFVFVTLISCIPLVVLFWLNYRKAVNAGLIVPTKSNRTLVESIKYYTIEFDVGGLLLLMGGLVFFLLPFSLFSYQDGLWESPLVISFFIIGILMLIGFVLYEKFIAPKTFIPYQLLLDRTVLGACVLSATLFVSFYIWNAYFSSFLLVVSGVNLTEATYVQNIYSIGSCFFSLIVGLLIRWTGRFKFIALYFGVPVTMLGVGLMIHFRQPGVPIGYVVMSQIFIAFAGGACVITEQIAVMAATDHQHVAVVLAIEGMFSAIGGGIGSSIAAAIWTGMFPKKLAEFLPAESQGELMNIYASLPTQLSYAKGTPTRLAIEMAYGESQKWMAVGGTTVMVIGLVSVMFWRDINLKNFKQVKGRVI